MPPPDNRPLSAILRRRILAFGYAFAGLGYALRTQINLRIHLAATLVVVAAGLWLEIGRDAWALLVLVFGMVWVSELFNTAIEATIDLVSPQPHPLAKIAKDCAAAAVLITAFAAIAVGLLILGPPLWARLGF